MPDVILRVVAAFACVLGWLVITAPVVVFLFSGRRRREREILGQFRPDDFRLYVEYFFPQSKRLRDNTQARNEMNEEYCEIDGLALYIFPFLLLALASGLGFGVVFVWVASCPIASAASLGIPPICGAATTGSLIWVGTEILASIRSGRFRPRVLDECVIRILSAVPVAYALSNPLKHDFAVPMALALGVFPTKTVVTIVRRFGWTLLGGSISDARAEAELVKLQNVNQADAEKFVDEGIGSISHLAWSNPVATAVRTGLPFNFVTDCQCQALIWVYFGEKSPELAKLSLRGALEVRNLVSELTAEKSPSSDDRASVLRRECEAVLSASAEVLHISPTALMRTFREIAEDPSTEILARLWHPVDASTCD